MPSLLLTPLTLPLQLHKQLKLLLILRPLQAPLPTSQLPLPLRPR
jgi:hypothetical protein